jgi:hypothetical protein
LFLQGRNGQWFLQQLLANKWLACLTKLSVLYCASYVNKPSACNSDKCLCKLPCVLEVSLYGGWVASGNCSDDIWSQSLNFSISQFYHW